MKDKMFTLRVSPKERKEIRKKLSTLKKKTRYSYYEIVMKGLNLYEASIK